MPAWGEILDEVEKTPPDPKSKLGPPGLVRNKYLHQLATYTGRETILYYSGWLSTPLAPPEMVGVGLADLSGFMNACSNLEGRELDLVLHSPGGDPDTVEQVSEYLRTRFDHIRAVVPVVAMSAATMLALSADEVLMGAHSQLGPIDPQVTIQAADGILRRASAQAIRDQFEMAKEECAANPAVVAAWMPSLQAMAPGLLAACDHAAKRARQIVEDAMVKYMLKDAEEKERKANEAAEWFGDARMFLSHGRPVRIDEARQHHVVISELEDDQKLQDALLSVHHASLISLQQNNIGKLIENSRDRRLISRVQTIVVEGEAAPPAEKKPPPPPRKRNRRKR